MAGRPAQARVKRCGKSAPAPGVTRAARQTPPGARPSVGRLARPMSPGRPHRWMATHPDPGNRPVDRIPPTGRLTVTLLTLCVDRTDALLLVEDADLGRRCVTRRAAERIHRGLDHP